VPRTRSNLTVFILVCLYSDLKYDSLELRLTSFSFWVWVWVLCYDRRSVGHLGLMNRILLLPDTCEFVNVGRSLWREDRSIVYNCCWPSPVQSFSGPSPMRLVSIMYCLRFETSLFCRLLRLTGLRWRYSTLPPHGIDLILSLLFIFYFIMLRPTVSRPVCLGI
jgi:hypothetical protein